ncbi:2OG-Fe(II) oxygenase [Hyphomonas sp.]|jgi:hypothetical protein|uniref:2OG-Fe(II) oxygenase n=1 Tax=Hyphomonas sp. TaxID=87 RepID=UPI000C96AB34|nr:2OG-Fe(II) oxygenase [Hyphomonas sp.]MAL47067.1 hypothetical protein [Hyphomonas sp.]|tara:strand:+ start:215 stop:796 length:582 start_codon:yes stop_codon:yes gene_type:complete
MKNKITDLKFHVDKLVPKDVCNYFINFYEDNIEHAKTERSYKHKTKTNEEDNYRCINLTHLYLDDNKFKIPLDIAKKYIHIMLINYELYIKNTICPTFDINNMSQSSNVRILKYKKGEYIKDHVDHEGSVRASCTLNLNEDYEGGEFRFFNGQIKHSFKTGDAMLFPAEPIWIHGTEPITKGVRYSINCFLHP